MGCCRAPAAVPLDMTFKKRDRVVEEDGEDDKEKEEDVEDQPDFG